MWNLSFSWCNQWMRIHWVSHKIPVTFPIMWTCVSSVSWIHWQVRLWETQTYQRILASQKDRWVWVLRSDGTYAGSNACLSTRHAKDGSYECQRTRHHLNGIYIAKTWYVRAPGSTESTRWLEFRSTDLTDALRLERFGLEIWWTCKNARKFCNTYKLLAHKSWKIP